MVDYNNFAKTFSKSRKNMKWLEMEYFLEKLNFTNDIKILDVGCGN
jgi:cyclopropane fatty-acyl-phospholipid synthase-like methyltransferase